MYVFYIENNLFILLITISPKEMKGLGVKHNLTVTKNKRFKKNNQLLL